MQFLSKRIYVYVVIGLVLLSLIGILMYTAVFNGQIESVDQSAAAIEAVSTRDDIAERYRWDLSDIYADIDDWRTDKAAFSVNVDKLTECSGVLGDSAEQMLSCLKLYEQLGEDIYHLAAYAYLLSDQDTRESEPFAMTGDVDQLWVAFSTASAFITPEIVALDEQLIEQFIAEESGLQNYAHFLEDVQRAKPHTRSTEVEEVIAEAGIMSGTASTLYHVFKDAEMPRAEIVVSADTATSSVRLDDAAFVRYAESDSRAERKEVFEKHFGGFKDFERTFGADFMSSLNKDSFYNSVYYYDSTLERNLDYDNLPTSVYDNLLTGVHNHLSTLWRYLSLRQDMLGVDELEYYDLRAPLTTESSREYTVDEAEALVKKALAPLGEEYQSVLDMAFTNRWIDFYPTEGKTPGGYMSGLAYGIHPYILMNYNGTYNDVSTLAHELGHAVHSYYSQKNQSFVNAQYPTFLAEIASLTNETLLADEILKELTDPAERLAILGKQLETYRTTLFRQTQFAEFEQKAHERAEAGETLTGEDLSALYLDILKQYYGSEEGVMSIDNLYGIEWAYVPHFYSSFYVYKYATSLCAAVAVADKLENNEDSMREKYVSEFLSAGGSDYPLEIMNRLGIDMTSPELCSAAFTKMGEIMDEIEVLR